MAGTTLSRDVRGNCMVLFIDNQASGMSPLGVIIDAVDDEW